MDECVLDLARFIKIILPLTDSPRIAFQDDFFFRSLHMNSLTPPSYFQHLVFPSLCSQEEAEMKISVKCY